MKRIIIVAFQGCYGIPGYDHVRLIIWLGHVGVYFPDEPGERIIYGFGPTEAAIAKYGNALAEHLMNGNSVPGNFHDDTDVFLEAFSLSQTRDEVLFRAIKDEDRLIVYKVVHPYPDDIYETIRDEILSWYNGATVPSVEYRLPPPTEVYDNCATVYRWFGIPSYEDLHKGQLAAYIKLVFKDPEIGSRWDPDRDV